MNIVYRWCDTCGGYEIVYEPFVTIETSCTTSGVSSHPCLCADTLANAEDVISELSDLAYDEDGQYNGLFPKLEDWLTRGGLGEQDAAS